MPLYEAFFILLLLFVNKLSIINNINLKNKYMNAKIKQGLNLVKKMGVLEYLEAICWLGIAFMLLLVAIEYRTEITYAWVLSIVFLVITIGVKRMLKEEKLKQ